MSDAATEIEPPAETGEPADPEEAIAEAIGRDRDLLGRRDPRSPIRKRLLEIRKAVREGFENQRDRADDIDDYWRIFNCVLSDKQTYNGNAGIFVPIVHDAVNARSTRFVGQAFPQSGRYVEAISSDGSTSDELVAILDHYIRGEQFKTNVAKPLSRNGDIEGQYNLFVDWNEIKRTLVSRETHGPIDPQTGQEMPGPEIVDITEEEITEGMPGFEVLHDTDVLVKPVTADSVDKALAAGGLVAIVRRWSTETVEAKIADGTIREDEGEELLDQMGKVSQDDRDIAKSLNEEVGIRKRGKEAVVWEVWTCLKLGDKGYSEKGERRLCRIFFGPSDLDLGAKRNPYWNDRCPLLSVPQEKIAGQFKGASVVSYVDSIQYEANDAANEMADADHYGALPIVARDPEAGDGPMILNLAAIWDIDPNKVKFMEFPDLGPRGIRRIQLATQQIFQTLGVNPAMLPQQSGAPGRKRNQAEIALEQSVDLLTTAEAVSVMEEGIYTPVCGWIVDLDYQFRDAELEVRMWGEMGHRAAMMKVAPLQNRHGFSFVWRGAEQVKMNAMMMQQGTAALNVAKGLTQQLQQEGVQLKLAPVVEQWFSNLFGPSLASKTIVDMRDQLTVDAELEVEMMLDGFETHPHPLDNDQQKIQVFHQALASSGDPRGTIRVRLQEQMRQMQGKAQAMMMQKLQQSIGAHGGGGPGQPQPGGQVAGPRLLKQAPGAIHRDQMPAAGAVTMPHLGGRRM